MNGCGSNNSRWWRYPFLCAAVVAGLALCGVAGAASEKSADAPPLYRYVMGQSGTEEDPGPVASALADQDIAVRSGKVIKSDDGMVLAKLKVAETPAGPVLVKWNPRVDPVFLRVWTPTPQEVADLASVLRRDMPANAVLMAWWDTSRLLALLSGVDVAFDQHLGIPLFVPVPWQGERERIESVENRFWQAQVDGADHARFQRFVDALLSKPQEGLAALRSLAGDQPVVLALHVRDIIQLAKLAPERIGVAFKDVQFSDVHGMVKRVKAWVGANGYGAHTVIRINDHRVRMIALMDEASANTLAARLLPFVGGFRQKPVGGTALVYKTDGFWVFEIKPPGAATETDSEKGGST